MFNSCFKYLRGWQLSPSVLIVLIILTSGCAGTQIKTQAPVGFYELCFSLNKLPGNTADKDLYEAAEIYARNIEKSGYNVLKRNVSRNSSCYFVDNVPDFMQVTEKARSNIAQYLLNAFFNKENASLYAVSLDRKSAFIKFDNIGRDQKLPIYMKIDNGLVLTGSDRKMLYAARYLEMLKIDHQFGYNEKGELIINVSSDSSERWMMVPFLYRSLELDEFVSLLPGDYAILATCRSKETDVEFRIPPWNYSKVPFIAKEGFASEDALVFSAGVLSLPFGEDVLLKYFYTLAESYRLPMSSSFMYSPNFNGVNVKPSVMLFSSEFLINGDSIFKPEKILLWIKSVDQQLKEYPDDFYANLLSLKIAKKLYTEKPSFLGGAELLNMTTEVPFESISQHLFIPGTVSVFGSMESNLYLYSEEVLSEYSSYVDIKKSKAVKAFYGSPKNSSDIIVSFVLRAHNSEVLIEKISTILADNGFDVFQTLIEHIAENDSWGSISVKTGTDKENKIVDIYNKMLKKLNNTLSIGVYRVSKENEE